LVLALVGIAAACGSSTSSVDGGTMDVNVDTMSMADAADASGDTSMSDVAPDTQSDGSDGSDDVTSNDGPIDAPTSGDAGAGSKCNPMDDLCQPGLLCCSEPTHIGDASTGFFCEIPFMGKCPLLP
jgi:hypothetical protein